MSRNFAFVSYADDTAPLLERCQSLGLCGAISPCHNADINKDSGEIKKAHYHVLLSFSGNKSEKSIKALAAEFGALWANGAFVCVSDKRAYYTYLYHGDSPDKAAYSVEDIICFGGFNPPTDVQDGFLLSEVLRLVNEKNICSFAQLVYELLEQNKIELLLEVRGHSYFYAAFLRDIRDSHCYNDNS